jgi:hypothetical protein
LLALATVAGLVSVAFGTRSRAIHSPCDDDSPGLPCTCVIVAPALTAEHEADHHCIYTNAEIASPCACIYCRFSIHTWTDLVGAHDGGRKDGVRASIEVKYRPLREHHMTESHTLIG